MSQISAEEAAAAVGIVLLIVIAIDIALLAAWLFTRGDVEAGRRPPLFAPRWSLVHVWVALHVIFGGVVSVGIILGLLSVLLGGGSTRNTQEVPVLFLPILLLVLNALFVAVPVWFITQIYRLRLSHIGFSIRIRTEELKKGVLWGFGLLIVGLGCHLILLLIVSSLLGENLTKDLTETSNKISNEQIIGESLKSPGLFLMMLVGAGVMAPVGEEFFFRGFLYNALKFRWNVAAATILSAFIFALFHIGPLQVLAIIPVGILLAIAYERSRSLWVPILMHSVFNSTQLILAYFLPQLIK